METVILIIAGVVVLFGFVVFFGAPYLPTFKKQTDTALDLLNLKAGQTLLELGSGDGRVLKAAAKHGLKVIGYELNPILVIISKLYTWRYRQQVRVVWANYWTAQWPAADGIFVFLLDRLMLKLDKKIIQQSKKPVRLVSFAFKIPNKKPKAIKNGLYLYIYK